MKSLEELKFFLKAKGANQSSQGSNESHDWFIFVENHGYQWLKKTKPQTNPKRNKQVKKDRDF